MYYPILPHRTQWLQFCALTCIIYVRRKAMKKQLECELHCKATASLGEVVAKEMNAEDRQLEELLTNVEKAENKQEDSSGKLSS